MVLPEDENAEVLSVNMVLLDWPQAVYNLRSGDSPWPARTIWPHQGDTCAVGVDVEQLVVEAREWVQADEGSHTEAYATAAEALPHANRLRRHGLEEIP